MTARLRAVNHPTEKGGFLHSCPCGSEEQGPRILARMVHIMTDLRTLKAKDNNAEKKAGPLVWLSRAARSLVGILPESVPCAVCPPLAAAATCPRNTQSLPRFSPFPGQLGPALGMGLKASCLHTTGSPREHQPCWPGEEVGRSLAPITHMFQAQKCGYSGRDAITSSSWGYGARAASAGTFSYLLETLSC